MTQESSTDPVNPVDPVGVDADPIAAAVPLRDFSIGKSLVINVPEFFDDKEFRDWLNQEHPLLTWHDRGKMPTEWSDTVVLVDPSLLGEGSDSNMPERFWHQIVATCRLAFPENMLQDARNQSHIMVRLTNLAA